MREVHMHSVLTLFLGIAVHPGAIDFSALARPAPSPSLTSRAAASDTTRRIWIITGIITLALLVVGGIFCAVVLCCMYRKKQQRKKRNLGLGTVTATHRYQPVNDIELEPGRPHELPVDYNSSSYGAELPSGAHGVPKVQELDGYIAPPKPSVLPAELPSNVRVYKDDYR